MRSSMMTRRAAEAYLKHMHALLDPRRSHSNGSACSLEPCFVGV